MISKFKYNIANKSLVQKYKNRIKELENLQKKDMNNLNKKGNIMNKYDRTGNITRNSSKISNVLEKEEF